TLFYSDVLGIPPCVLCWWQRVFLYPQVVLFAIALWKKDHSIASYSIPLSIIGFAIGLYNHALQVLPSGTLPCPAQGVSCAQRFVFEFGYITFPMMAVTLFGFLIVLMLIVRNRQR
ncbi:disulfide bond formation protein B, partial [Candidatus Kaiserbacteria bacterium]|nr:disulfide bond formation protein B [Candidatus Kaiserbacteria bacterium]